MSKMFYGCQSLTSLDLSNFWTSSSMTMEEMFYECSSLTSLDLSNFATNFLYNVNKMFKGCSNLEYLDISNFYGPNININSIVGIFSGCNKLEYIKNSHCIEGENPYFSYNNACYKNCPNGTRLSINGDNKECIELIYCPINLPFEKNRECVSNCTL